jgi:RNA polymerase sigma factor (sigma-70 family)
MRRNQKVSPICQHDIDRERCPLCRPEAAHTYATLSANLNALLHEARPRLLRLARLNGISADLAEDVVQETCMEAWQHLQQLREPARFSSWLDGICRNVCRRQTSALNRNEREIPLGGSGDEGDVADFDRLDPLDFDLNEALERQDRQILLDRALGHLSESTRELIELCYLAELPQREVAARLEMSLGALELKLHRARRQLRQVLSGALRADAGAFGLLVNQDEAVGWQETRQWCWLCGKHRLRGTFERHPSGVIALRLRCPDCSPRYGIDMLGSGEVTSLAGLRSFRPAMRRATRAACGFFVHTVQHRTCGTCQCPVHVRIGNRHAPGDTPEPGPSPFFPDRSYFFIDCPRCGSYGADLALLLLEPVACAFVVDRPRVIIEPDTLASYAGQDAICSRLVDLNTAERVTIMAHPETLQVMATLLP